MQRRLFVGVFPPEEIRRALTEALSPGWQKTAGLKTVPPHQWHVTLHFLGPTPEDLLSPLKTLLQQAALSVAGFHTTLEGCGAFPDSNRPKVLFLRASDAEGLWARTAGKIRRVSQDLGFTPEEKPFQPHLTLARMKDPSAGAVAARDWETRLEGFRASWAIEGFCLVESRLDSSGPTYEVLETFRLKG